MWNSGCGSDPRDEDHAAERIGQPDIFPPPGGKPFHGKRKASVQEPSDQDQCNAKTDMTAHFTLARLPARNVNQVGDSGAARLPALAGFGLTARWTRTDSSAT